MLVVVLWGDGDDAKVAVSVGIDACAEYCTSDDASDVASREVVRLWLMFTTGMHAQYVAAGVCGLCQQYRER